MSSVLLCLTLPNGRALKIYATFFANRRTICNIFFNVKKAQILLRKGENLSVKWNISLNLPFFPKFGRWKIRQQGRWKTQCSISIARGKQKSIIQERKKVSGIQQIGEAGLSSGSTRQPHHAFLLDLPRATKPVLFTFQGAWGPHVQEGLGKKQWLFANAGDFLARKHFFRWKLEK